jgi:predicted amidohydrolase YtcJ
MRDTKYFPAFAAPRFALRSSALMAGCWLAAFGLASPVIAQEVADVVLHNGTVYTVNSSNEMAEAVAVKDGRILAVGSTAEIDGLIGAGTEVVDLGGKVLMPGLVDSHMHPKGGGAQLTSCSLNYAALSVPEALALITACIEADKTSDSAAWVQVQGWFRQAMTPAGADLTAADLDSLPTSRPVVVMASDFHTMAASTAALEAAGVTDATANPSDGEIVRDANGKATGILLDGAMWLVGGAAPPLPEAAEAAKTLTDLEAALTELRKQGVTTMLDAAAGEDGIASFAKLRQEGKLTVRAQFATVVSVDEMVDPATAVAGILTMGEKYNTPQGEVEPGLSLRTAKVFMDGVIQAPAQTGWLMLPYLHNKGTDAAPDFQPSTAQGSLYVNQDKLTAFMEAAAEAGLRVHMHTDGDGAVNVALNAVEATRAKYPDLDFRPALAHCELMQPEDYARFAALKAQPVLSLQWGKPAPDTLDSVEDYIGPERFKFLETAGKFRDAGAQIAYGSDWPVDALNEWYAMEVGMTRENDVNPDPAYAGRLGDDPGLDLVTSLRAFTINAAYSLGMDQEIGSIETGKLADLIVIDRDPAKVEPKSISDTKVLLTLLGGKEVYRAPEFSRN